MNASCKTLQNGYYRTVNAYKFRAMIAERAYGKAEKRGFAAGHELDDWLETEREVNNQCIYWHLEIQ